MSNRTLIDADIVLSHIDQWNQLDKEWGTPVDLDTEEQDVFIREVKSCYSTLENKQTFDSGPLLKKMHRSVRRNFAKTTEGSLLDYEVFLQDLETEGTSEKSFYFVGGEIISAASVSNICRSIENVFRSIDKLSIITSTVREKKPKVSGIIESSISATGLSFDDTCDGNVDEFIDELFQALDRTMASLQSRDLSGDRLEDGSADCTMQDSVTTLVRKFSSFLESPAVKCSRKRRGCSERFRQLTEFWNSMRN